MPLRVLLKVLKVLFFGGEGLTTFSRSCCGRHIVPDAIMLALLVVMLLRWWGSQSAESRSWSHTFFCRKELCEKPNDNLTKSNKETWREHLINMTYFLFVNLLNMTYLFGIAVRTVMLSTWQGWAMEFCCWSQDGLKVISGYHSFFYCEMRCHENWRDMYILDKNLTVC